VRVLVVDDYPGVAEISCLMLRLLGNEAMPALDGRDAITKLIEFSPEVVILDIGLPDRIGYDVARELRSYPGGDALHIAALTGWDQPEDRVRSVAAGIDQHFVKPACTAKFREILSAAKARTGRKGRTGPLMPSTC
jgi:DNA-binding response OmpR family regulator